MNSLYRFHWWTYILIGLVAVLILAPFGWMISTALMTTSQTLRVPPSLLPWPITFQGLEQVFQRLPFFTLLSNTFVAAILRMIGTLIVGMLAAYALAVIKVPGARVILVVILTLIMVPGDIFIIPNYVVVSSLHLTNTLVALVLPEMFDVFAVFLLYQFFRGIPRELVEAARIDGASHLRILATIVVPISWNGITTVALLALLAEWKDFLWPIIVNGSIDKLTVGPGLALLSGQYTTQWNVLMSAGVLAALPMVIIFLILQKQFIASVARSGMK